MTDSTVTTDSGEHAPRVPAPAIGTRPSTLIDLLPHPVVRADTTHTARGLNKAGRLLIATRGDEARALDRLLSPDNWAIAAPHVEEVLRGHHNEFILTIPRGTPPAPSVLRTYIVRLVPDCGPDGTAEGYFAVFDDVSRIKMTENALRDGERMFRNLANGVPILIWTCDSNLQLQFTNARWLSLTGISPTPGTRWLRAVHPGDRERVIELRRRVFSTAEPYETTYRLQTADDETRWLREFGSPDIDARGTAVRCLGGAADVTDSKRLEDQQRQQIAELEHNSRLTLAGQMTSAILHEIAQPLGATINFLRAATHGLSPSDLGAEPARLLDRARESAERASDVARSMRDFARRRGTDRRRTELSEVLEPALRLLCDDGRLRGIDLAVDLAATPVPVLVDPMQIQQVLFNLVKNAFEAVVEHGVDKPRVRVSTALAGEWASVRVCDNGPGIPPNQRARLFEAFQSERPEGLGLGMWICWNILERHGGRIEVTPEESAPGAVVQFLLPTAD